MIKARTYNILFCNISYANIFFVIMVRGPVHHFSLNTFAYLVMFFCYNLLRRKNICVAFRKLWNRNKPSPLLPFFFLRYLFYSIEEQIDV